MQSLPGDTSIAQVYCCLPNRVDGQGKGAKQSRELGRGSPVMSDVRSPAGSGPRTWRGAPLRPHPHPHPALTHCTRVPESGQISQRRSAASQEGLRGAVPASPDASTDSALRGKRKHRAGEKAQGAPPLPSSANQRRDLAGCSASAPPPRRARCGCRSVFLSLVSPPPGRKSGAPLRGANRRLEVLFTSLETNDKEQSRRPCIK